MEDEGDIIDTLVEMALAKKYGGWDEYSAYALLRELPPETASELEEAYGPRLGAVIVKRAPILEGFIRVKRKRGEYQGETGEDDWGE